MWEFLLLVLPANPVGENPRNPFQHTIVLGPPTPPCVIAMVWKARARFFSLCSSQRRTGRTIRPSSALPILPIPYFKALNHYHSRLSSHRLQQLLDCRAPLVPCSCEFLNHRSFPGDTSETRGDTQSRLQWKNSCFADCRARKGNKDKRSAPPIQTALRIGPMVRRSRYTAILVPCWLPEFACTMGQALSLRALFRFRPSRRRGADACRFGNALFTMTARSIETPAESANHV